MKPLFGQYIHSLAFADDWDGLEDDLFYYGFNPREEAQRYADGIAPDILDGLMEDPEGRAALVRCFKRRLLLLLEHAKENPDIYLPDGELYNLID